MIEKCQMQYVGIGIHREQGPVWRWCGECNRSFSCILSDSEAPRFEVVLRQVLPESTMFGNVFWMAGWPG